MRKKTLKLLGICGIALFMLAATIPSNRFFEIAKNLEIYASLFKTVNEVYVDEINPNKLFNVSVKAMLATLDPYTVYISEDKIEDYRTLSTGQYGGIGASTIRLHGRVFISSIVQGGPANLADIEVGDEIISASGILVKGKSNEDLNQLVRGQAKTSLELGIKKNGSKTTTNINVLREKITIKNVPYFGMLKNNVGYIKFVQFTENGGKNISKAVKDLKKEGASSLILDLRNNPGGLLKEAVDICNIFIPKDKLVVETKGKRPENSNTFKTLNQPIDLSIPVVVIINHSSASASEIVSGTLQDYDRAVILGQKSYGKGLVQNVRPLTYNAQLKVTIAKYYTPSGRCIQALDYSHRNKNGSVGKVPDSLKTAYKTSVGRIVYDGGGIDPDILMKDVLWDGLVIKLIQSGSIYLYANDFKLKHKTIPSPTSFNLSDEEYNDFIVWMQHRNFDYKNPVEKDLSNIDTLSKELNTSSKLFASTLGEIEKDVHKSLKEQLLAQKSLLKNILEEEIALRYYNEQGGIETTLSDDKEIDKAIEVLGNLNEYDSILGVH